MLRLHRPRWSQKSAKAPVALVYVVVALVLGFRGAELGANTLGVGRHSSIASDSAVSILSSIASGTMVLTGIVFALVLVALQVVGSSYSPRIVDLLNRNRFLGHALGVFTGTFIYALLAIRTVDLQGGPGLNTTVVVVSLVWLIASVVFLSLLLPQIKTVSITFVLPALHKLATTAIARVYKRVSFSTLHVAERTPVDLAPPTGEHHHRGEPRYLVGYDVERLVRWASETDAVVVIPVAIGDVVIDGDQVAVVHGGSTPMPEAQLRRALWFFLQRMPENDPAYSIRLLVDVAVRALSPAVNDPTTAVYVLDELDGLLRTLGNCALEEDVVRDRHGVVRVVRAVPSWDELVALALTEIQEYGRDSSEVQRRFDTLIQDLVTRLPADRRPAIERFARWRDSQPRVRPSRIERLAIEPTDRHIVVEST